VGCDYFLETTYGSEGRSPVKGKETRRIQERPEKKERSRTLLDLSVEDRRWQPEGCRYIGVDPLYDSLARNAVHAHFD
jgi:hypothetical protein